MCVNGQCINNQGSFRCQCARGFTLGPDRRTCLGRFIPYHICPKYLDPKPIYQIHFKKFTVSKCVKCGFGKGNDLNQDQNALKEKIVLVNSI